MPEILRGFKQSVVSGVLHWIVNNNVYGATAACIRPWGDQNTLEGRGPLDLLFCTLRALQPYDPRRWWKALIIIIIRSSSSSRLRKQEWDEHQIWTFVTQTDRRILGGCKWFKLRVQWISFNQGVSSAGSAVGTERDKSQYSSPLNFALPYGQQYCNVIH